jgi:hypothetical protein
MTVFTDAEWAGVDVDGRRSYGGMVSFIGRAAVSWRAWKHKCVTDSSTEAEYLTMHAGVRMVQWLETVINGMGIDLMEVPSVVQDNQGAIALASDVKLNERTKHIDVKYHAVRERLAEGQLVIDNCASQEQVADLFTKDQTVQQFEMHRRAIGVMRWEDRPASDPEKDPRLMLCPPGHVTWRARRVRGRGKRVGS